MSLTSLYSGTNGTWGTEYSLTNGSTVVATKSDVGVFELFLDLAALLAGDQYELKIYEKARSGDTQRLVDVFTITGVQNSPLKTYPAIVLMFGWDFTLKRVAGSDRTITWSVRQVA